MKYKFDNKYIMIAILTFSVICGALLLNYILANKGTISSLYNTLMTALLPILSGMILAYLLNPILKGIEKYVFTPLFKLINKKIKKDFSFYIRLCSIVVTMAIFFLFLTSMIYLVVPQVYKSLNSIVGELSNYYTRVDEVINMLKQDHSEMSAFLLNTFEQGYIQVLDYLQNVVTKNLDKVAVSITSGIVVGVKSVFNVVLAIIISIYVMFEKENMIALCKKLTYSLFDNNKANTVIHCTRFVDDVFGGFISGKIIDSFIIGILCYIFMIIFGFEYPVLISIVVGVTNVIPYFGPFIGAIPSVFILFMVEPRQGLLFAVFVLALQQLDGNFIGPLILGDRLKISSMWILFAILIGGSLFGVIGMVLGAPFLACIFAILRWFTKERLDSKNLPIQSQYYYDIDYIDGNQIHKLNKN